MADYGYQKLDNEIDISDQVRNNEVYCQLCKDKQSRASVQCQTCQTFLCNNCKDKHENDFVTHITAAFTKTRANVSKRKFYTSVGYINIKTADDRHTCSASGLVFLSPDLLAIADKTNKCIKIVDVDKNEVVSKVRLTSGPRDLTVVPPEMLAVTLTDEELIQIMATKPELSKLRQIKTSGKCRNIAYSLDRFIVTFGGLLFSKIQLLSLKGEILTTLDFNDREDYVVYDPRGLGISMDENHFYVTDLLKSSLFRLSFAGKVTGVYKDLGEVTGLAVVGNDEVYSCSRDRNSVRRFSADLSTSKIVLDVNDGLSGPLALTHSLGRSSLFISYCKGSDEGRNRIHVFKIN